MNILFMGTPDIAAAALEAILDAGHTVCGVYTRADKPVGRKQVLTAPPVKRTAMAHGIPVVSAWDAAGRRAGGKHPCACPELIVVVAYGRILPKDILDVPPLGCVNVHASLLPKYRGAAPINWAMLNGDAETGVSIMYMAEELDAGDVIRVAKTPIDPEEDLPSLWNRLAELGADALSAAIPTLAGRHCRPDAPGRQSGDLCAYAVTGTVSH